jgi:hypothetical protein
VAVINAKHWPAIAFISLVSSKKSIGDPNTNGPNNTASSSLFNALTNFISTD